MVESDLTGAVPKLASNSIQIAMKAFSARGSTRFHRVAPEFGFISLKWWPGTILMNGR
jgi:hypothetical protein